MGRHLDRTKVGWKGVDWIDTAQDRDKWWAVVNAVINLRFKKKTAELLDYQRIAVGACAARFQLDEDFVAICLQASLLT
jgi:hypothetical protein